jgi:hypothetical protein
MGRLIAGVIALAVFVCGSMYWSQAEQLNTMPAQPLCPGVTCADKAITPIDNAAAVAPEASAAKDDCAKDCGAGSCSEKKSCCPGECQDKAEKTVDA